MAFDWGAANDGGTAIFHYGKDDVHEIRNVKKLERFPESVQVVTLDGQRFIFWPDFDDLRAIQLIPKAGGE